MATVDVDFDFLCTTASLRYSHPIPTTLINGAETAKTSPEYQQLFARNVLPIVKEHHDECFAESPRVCSNCEGGATHALMTPTSYTASLSPTDDRLYFSNLPQPAKELRQRPPVKFPGLPAKVPLPCGLCGNCERTLKCSECGTIAYCSKEHQKNHWKVHKPMCAGKKPVSTD